MDTMKVLFVTVSAKIGHVRTWWYLEKHLFKNFELKLTGFARARPLLCSRTGLSNLLNKIQFIFEIVPC